MPNTVYDNFYLSNEVEDQYNSHLDLQRFCTVDNGLVGTPGMKRKINRYSATNGTQKLTMGNGNTQSITVGYAPYEYEIQLAQNRFEYYDEEAMTDPMVVPVGVRHMGTDMFNTVNADVFAEFNKATMILPVSLFDFSTFADAQAMLKAEDLEDTYIFAFVSPADVAAIRKALKDDLKYVEAFSKQGYIGTVAGVNIFTKRDAVSGTIVMATNKAVTLFNKKGTEVEQVTGNSRSETAANVRLNTIFSRKYYLAALTDATKAVKIEKGIEMQLTEDATVVADKAYYTAGDVGYIQVTPESGDNPASEGWYEIAD